MTRYYASTHEWVLINGSLATVGISQHAQSLLGDVVFASLPKLGRKVARSEELAVLESVKTAAEVYAPLSGVVIEINEEVETSPSLVNTDPLDAGWLFKLRLTHPAEAETLLSEEAYQANQR